MRVSVLPVLASRAKDSGHCVSCSFRYSRSFWKVLRPYCWGGEEASAGSVSVKLMQARGAQRSFRRAAGTVFLPL